MDQRNVLAEDIRGFRRHIPMHRQTTTCLESFAFAIAIYHFATGGYLGIRNLKDWTFVGRHQRTYNKSGISQEITTISEAFDTMIVPFACGTAYQFVCAGLGFFLANAIGRKNGATLPKCQTWLLCITVTNINGLLLLSSSLEFYSMCWMLFRSILEVCIVSGFTTEVRTDEQEIAARQEILDRLHAQIPQREDFIPQFQPHMILENMNLNRDVNWGHPALPQFPGMASSSALLHRNRSLPVADASGLEPIYHL